MKDDTQPTPPDLLLTTDLIHQVKLGDPAALDSLMARYLPRLIRWAGGRLPPNVRSLLETTDLVHETLLKVIEGLDRFDETRPGGFQSYVHQAILNRVTDEIRKARRRVASSVDLGSLVDNAPSPLQNTIGRELYDRYDRARERLSEEERMFVHLRIELDFSYEEIAAMMGRPTQDAARMAVKRSLRKLAEMMRDDA